jgi:hypothetical protein
VHALLLQLVNCGKILENTLALIGFTPPNLAHGQVALWRTGYQWDGGNYSAPGKFPTKIHARLLQLVNHSKILGNEFESLAGERNMVESIPPRGKFPPKVHTRLLQLLSS